MINFEQFFLEQTHPQYVVVYPGRFQPMLKHHRAVYDKLAEEYGEGSVYIATSDSVKLPKSPLSFVEKQQVMTQLMGVPADKIINVKAPYAGESYAHLGSSDSILIISVGYKDQHPIPPEEAQQMKDTDKALYKDAVNHLVEAVHDLIMKIKGDEVSIATVRSQYIEINDSDFRAITGTDENNIAVIVQNIDQLANKMQSPFQRDAINL